MFEELILKVPGRQPLSRPRGHKHSRLLPLPFGILGFGLDLLYQLSLLLEGDGLFSPAVSSQPTAYSLQPTDYSPRSPVATFLVLALRE